MRAYDEMAEIERRLEWYSKPGKRNISENHYRDIRLFVAFLKNNPTEVNLFKEVGFLVSVGEGEGEEQLYWSKAKDIFLDAPYETTGLAELTAIHKKRKLWADYLEHLGKKVGREEFVSFLKSVGVMHEFTVTSADARRNIGIKSRWAGYETYTQINVDWTIQNIEEYCEAGNQTASCMIWMALLRANREVSEAKYRPNQQRDLEKAESQLVQQLKSCAWIPDLHGVFREPQDMTRDMLPTEFPYDDRNGLLTAIGFEETAKEASEEFKARDADAKKLGFGSATELEEALDLLKAKREGRIREVSTQERESPEQGTKDGPTGTNGEGGNNPVSQPRGPETIKRRSKFAGHATGWRSPNVSSLATYQLSDP